MQELSSDFKQFFLVKNNLETPIPNNADDADNADDYNRMIHIGLLKAFSCAKNKHRREKVTSSQ